MKDSDIIKAIVAEFGGTEGIAKEIKAIYDNSSSPIFKQEMLVMLIRLHNSVEPKQ